MRRLIPVLALLAATLSTADARTKLVTLPERARTVVSLENPNETLLFEEREIALQEGTNQIDFAWNGVSIDPRSVLFEVLTHPGTAATSTKIISIAYPPNEQALTWEIFSPEARTERIRVSYLLRGVSQESSYEFRVDEKETGGDFQQYTLLRNQSGERLGDATLRLRGLDDLTRTMETGEARRLLALRNKALPMRKLYIARPGATYFKGEEGEDISLVYEIENSEKSGLGRSALLPGKVRIYGDDGTGSTIFLGEDYLDRTAPGEKAELTLGAVKDIVLKRYQLRNERKNQRFNNSRTAVLWDVEMQLRYEVENFKDSATTLRIHEEMAGDWEVTSISDSSVRQERKSAGELQLEVDLPARPAGKEAEKREIIVTVLIRNVFPGER